MDKGNFSTFFYVLKPVLIFYYVCKLNFRFSYSACILMSIFQTGELMNVVHRHPSLLHKMVVTETKLITASPERPGTISVLSYW